MPSEPKRHHYVPRFLLRRFAEDPIVKKPLTWWLNKNTGANERRNVDNEAVVGHYYRLSSAGPLPSGFPEQVLSNIEGAAAHAIDALEANPSTLSLEGRQALALFVVLQHKRTPAARKHFRFIDEFIARLATEVNLSNAESWTEALKATGNFASPEQAERERLEALQAMKEGRLSVESSPDREIAGVFMAAPEVASLLAGPDFAWSVIRATGTTRFVLGDSPVALFETSRPEKPGGLGFATPGVETTLPVSPTTCLLIRPGPGSFQELSSDDRLVRHVNLRAYAWAAQCIWGRSHQDVVDVRRQAKADPLTLHVVRRRDGVPWLGTAVPGESGVYDFEGHYPDGRRQQQRFFVDPRQRTV